MGESPAGEETPGLPVEGSKWGREEIQDATDVASYLHGASLETLLKQLSENGITQKAFAEIIGMNSRHLSALKSSEVRHHYFNELGATKLACLWVLEHLAEIRK